MPVAWFIADIRRVRPPAFIPPGSPAGRAVARRHAIFDYADVIGGDGGGFRAVEVLGQRALVKVRASVGVLQQIASDAAVTFIPGSTAARIDEPLTGLSLGQKATLRAAVTNLGYTAGEVQAALGGDLGAVTLGELLRFIASRRRKVRYDAQSDAIVDDGPVVVGAYGDVGRVDAVVA